MDRSLWTNPNPIQNKAIRVLKRAGWRELKDNESVEFKGAHNVFELKAKKNKVITESSDDVELKKPKKKKEAIQEEKESE